MTQIYIIRHGEAEGNAFRRVHGHYDSLLTPRGFRQTACLEKQFSGIHIDACFSSDLTRTSLTARSVYVPKGLRLQRDARFREVSLGVWEDLPVGCVEHDYPEEFWQFNHDIVHWHTDGAERYEEFTQRFLEGLRDAAQAFDGGTIAVFTHGAVIRGSMSRLFSRGQEDGQPFCDNTGVCSLRYSRGEFQCDYLNDNSHLPEELSTLAAQRRLQSTRCLNLYYRLYSSVAPIPEGLTVPDIDSQGLALTAVIQEQPVGIISMSAPKAGTGRILGITIKDGMEGLSYGDQLLGTAFSHFRGMGCARLAANPGTYPDDVLTRYDFDPVTLERNISTKIYDWGGKEA